MGEINGDAENSDWIPPVKRKMRIFCEFFGEKHETSSLSPEKIDVYVIRYYVFPNSVPVKVTTGPIAFETTHREGSRYQDFASSSYFWR